MDVRWDRAELRFKEKKEMREKEKEREKKKQLKLGTMVVGVSKTP